MSKTLENQTNDENEFLIYRQCSRKRAFATLDNILLYLDYFSSLYDKPFGYYQCQNCFEFHLYSIKNPIIITE